MRSVLCLAILFLPGVLLAGPAAAQSVEGGSVRVQGNLVIGGMEFPGGSAELRRRIVDAGHDCNTIRGFTVLPEGLIVYCNAEQTAYRILPDADGEPIIAPD